MCHLPIEFPVRGSVQLRLLLQEDLLHLEWHGGPDLRSFYVEMWHRHVTRDATVIVAELNEFPIGQIVIHWSGKPAHLDFPDQQSLRVHPAFRGMGLGSALIEASETFVAAAGYGNVGLSVNVENHKARRLYERLGYSVVGESYEDRWDYIDASGVQILVAETVLDMVKPLKVHQCPPELVMKNRKRRPGRAAVFVYCHHFLRRRFSWAS